MLPKYDSRVIEDLRKVRRREYSVASGLDKLMEEGLIKGKGKVLLKTEDYFYLTDKGELVLLDNKWNARDIKWEELNRDKWLVFDAIKDIKEYGGDVMHEIFPRTILSYLSEEGYVGIQRITPYNKVRQDKSSRLVFINPEYNLSLSGKAETLYLEMNKKRIPRAIYNTISNIIKGFFTKGEKSSSNGLNPQ